MEMIIAFIVYLLIGFGVIYWIAGKSSSEENSAWVVAYSLGLFFWPAIIINYIRYKNKLNN